MSVSFLLLLANHRSGSKQHPLTGSGSSRSEAQGVFLSGGRQGDSAAKLLQFVG